MADKNDNEIINNAAKQLKIIEVATIDNLLDIKDAKPRAGRKNRKDLGKQELLYLFDNNRFGEKLKEIRKSHGDNQQELADKLKMTSAMLGLYERGNSQPPLEVLFNFSKIYNISVDYLLGLSPIQEIQFKEKDTEIKVNMPCPAVPVFKEIEESETFVLQVVNGKLKILKAE